MKRIVIIGAGFGGISVARGLLKSKLQMEILLIDKRQTSDFLPLLPDAIGRGIQPRFLSAKIESLVDLNKLKFINQEVSSVELENKRVLTAAGKCSYDYLVISSGSQPNFYGNEDIKKYTHVLNCVSDVYKISGVLTGDLFDTFVIGGGGYTGVETATNLRVLLKRAKLNKRIIILERADTILGQLPIWMRNYAFANLKKLDIELFTNATIESIYKNEISISGGRKFNKAMLIWVAGVKTADFIQKINAEKNPQGRLKVDEFLRINKDCFVAGDAAWFFWQKDYLRMAVQFAISQGSCAAVNIIRSIKDKPLVKFNPLDLGYVIPMANNLSCGKVLGFSLKGYLPTFLHFIMCLYRLPGFRNKAGVFVDLIAKKTPRPKPKYV